MSLSVRRRGLGGDAVERRRITANREADSKPATIGSIIGAIRVFFTVFTCGFLGPENRQKQTRLGPERGLWCRGAWVHDPGPS